MTAAWWNETTGTQLAQGDLLPECILPVFTSVQPGTVDNEPLRAARLIVVTQSCDLENHKADFVALCPVHTLPEFEAVNPSFKKKGAWESVRKGRIEGLHLLASPKTPDDNRAALVVDFGLIISLPADYLSSHAGDLGNRWRLASPFLDHFSQAFARFFMRVGLPAGLEPYK